MPKGTMSRSISIMISTRDAIDEQHFDCFQRQLKAMVKYFQLVGSPLKKTKQNKTYASNYGHT